MINLIEKEFSKEILKSFEILDWWLNCGTEISKSKNLDFQHVPIWIQLWGLPMYYRTKEMGRQIGSIMGHVDESNSYEYPEKNFIITIKVYIDTT